MHSRSIFAIQFSTFGSFFTSSICLVRYSKLLTVPDGRRVRDEKEEEDEEEADDDVSPIYWDSARGPGWRFINYFWKKGGKVFPITVFCEGLPRATRQGVRLMATRTHRTSSLLLNHLLFLAIFHILILQPLYQSYSPTFFHISLNSLLTSFFYCCC